MNGETLVSILSLIDKTETMSKYGSVKKQTAMRDSEFINRHKATDIIEGVCGFFMKANYIFTRKEDELWQTGILLSTGTLVINIIGIAKLKLRLMAEVCC